MEGIASGIGQETARLHPPYLPRRAAVIFRGLHVFIFFLSVHGRKAVAFRVRDVRDGEFIIVCVVRHGTGYSLFVEERHNNNDENS